MIYFVPLRLFLVLVVPAAEIPFGIYPLSVIHESFIWFETDHYWTVFLDFHHHVEFVRLSVTPPDVSIK
jgi:hypothetical protein